MAKNHSSGLTLLCLILTLSLLSPSLYSLCPTAERTIVIPAVVNASEGGLLGIRVRVQPGDGQTLSTIEPMVGAMTQASQALAAKEAFRGLPINPDECEVHFYIYDAHGAPSVDGPSAGMAMTTALRAALTNKTIRNDVSITGAILPGGAAGAVGGIIDKAQASARGGMRVFITPRQELYENIILQRLGLERNFVAVEVSSLSESLAYATSPAGSVVSSNHTLSNEPLPSSLTPREQNDDDRLFAQVSHRLNSMLRERLQKGGLFAQASYGPYFQTEVDNNEKLANLGYAYTAANNAFLTQVDAAFLSLPAHEPDVEGAANEVLDCVRQAPSVVPTQENFEWVAGGSARIQWAMQKIEDIKKASMGQTSSEEAYLSLRDVYYAQAWCDAGTQLLIIGQEIGGHSLNESALAALAASEFEKESKELGSTPFDSGDLSWHLAVANRSMGRQLYAAALFDKAYVQGSRAATLDELYRQNASEGVEANYSAVGSRPLSTLWGRTYTSQGQFIKVTSLADNDTADSRRVWQMAIAMEEQMAAAKNISTDGRKIEAIPAAAAVYNPSSSSSSASSLSPALPFPLPSLAFEIAAALFLMAVCLALGVAIGRRIQKSVRSNVRRK